MKAAIYINEGTTQVVLTPENKWEKNALQMIDKAGKVGTFWGEFYECQGGWIRQSPYPQMENSLIFRLEQGMDIPKEPT